MMHRFSRWPEAITMMQMPIESVASAFYTHWIVRFSAQSILQQNNHSNSNQLLGAKHILATSYHSNSNGLIERWDWWLKAAFISLFNATDRSITNCSAWSQNLFQGRHQGIDSRIVLHYASQLTSRIFRERNIPADPPLFLEKFAEHMRQLRPNITVHHIKP
jgi:hypothetical protein